ncbi:MAG: hypothetical protein MJ095_00145 [Oscillospiraceae bacterium]|nr:hypothetical protein [Oscillospiraceae bacterium]
MNPILSMLQNSDSGNLLSQIVQIKNMLSGKNPDDLYNQMMENNPQFRQFIEANKGKSVEQIAKENGINPQLLK